MNFFAFFALCDVPFFVFSTRFYVLLVSKRYCLPERAFSHYFHVPFCFSRRPFFFIFFVFCGIFFCTYIRRTSIPGIYMSMLAPDIYYHHRTAVQHSKAQRRQPAQHTTQAGRPSWHAPACRQAYIQLAMLQRTKKLKSAWPGTQNYCWCDARRVCLCALLFLSGLSILSIHAASGVFFGDHGAVGICKSPVCTEKHGPLCAIQLSAFWFNSFF